MNCRQADRLLDDYLDDGLLPRDRRRLEAHIASCSRCDEELCSRSSLDRSVRQALDAEAHSRFLPSAASARIVARAQAGLRRSIWSQRVLSAFRPIAAVIAAALALVGLYFLLGSVPSVLKANPVTLSPVKHLIQSVRRIASTQSIRELDPADPSSLAVLMDEPPARSLGFVDSLIEPSPMHPGDPFTITLVLQNDMLRPVQAARFDLEISGPTGYYRFPLSTNGPFPANGVSSISVTPEVLDAQCQSQYLISPLEIFDAPGLYSLRLSLFGPAGTQER